MAKRKSKSKTTPCKGEWTKFPQQEMGVWIGEWIFSRLAFKYWDKKKQKCKIKEFRYTGIKEYNDGSADLLFEVRW